MNAKNQEKLIREKISLVINSINGIVSSKPFSSNGLNQLKLNINTVIKLLDNQENMKAYSENKKIIRETLNLLLSHINNTENQNYFSELSKYSKILSDQLSKIEWKLFNNLWITISKFKF